MRLSSRYTLVASRQAAPEFNPDPLHYGGPDGAHREWTASGLPEQIGYRGQGYHFTGKIGVRQDQDGYVFEYETDDSGRIWVSADRKVFPD